MAAAEGVTVREQAQIAEESSESWISCQMGDSRVPGHEAGNSVGQRVTLARAGAGDSRELCLCLLSSCTRIISTCFLQGMVEEGKMNCKQPSHGEMKPPDGAHQMMARAGQAAPPSHQASGTRGQHHSEDNPSVIELVSHLSSCPQWANPKVTKRKAAA